MQDVHVLVDISDGQVLRNARLASTVGLIFQVFHTRPHDKGESKRAW